MDSNDPVPFMRLTTDTVPVPKVKRGMSIDQVREVWHERSEAKTKEIMDKYTKQKAGRSGGREGLGIYGQFQSRAAREKLRLAERLLKSAGLPTDDATVRKVMRQ
jgi:hypothetical protein